MRRPIDLRQMRWRRLLLPPLALLSRLAMEAGELNDHHSSTHHASAEKGELSERGEK